VARNTLFEFPRDLQIEILCFLNLVDVARLREISVGFQQLANEEVQAVIPKAWVTRFSSNRSAVLFHISDASPPAFELMNYLPFFPNLRNQLRKHWKTGSTFWGSFTYLGHKGFFRANVDEFDPSIRVHIPGEGSVRTYRPVTGLHRSGAGPTSVLRFRLLFGTFAELHRFKLHGE
jgi:hypothetical protein